MKMSLVANIVKQKKEEGLSNLKLVKKRTKFRFVFYIKSLFPKLQSLHSVCKFSIIVSPPFE